MIVLWSQKFVSESFYENLASHIKKWRGALAISTPCKEGSDLHLSPFRLHSPWAMCSHALDLVSVLLSSCFRRYNLRTRSLPVFPIQKGQAGPTGADSGRAVHNRGNLGARHLLCYHLLDKGQHQVKKTVVRLVVTAQRNLSLS